MRFSAKLNKIHKVICGISGGVDSAVAALILKSKGYDVHGIFMKNWDSANEQGVCLADVDREDAKFVCEHLDIPFHDVNFVKEYWNEVFSAFLQDLHAGKSPNPDVLCNRYIKFNALSNYCLNELGADAMATGHYVRSSAGYDLDSIDPQRGVNLMKAADPGKCQTLFLSQISQSSLQRALFPLGDMLKRDVKQLARESGMDRIADRKESMGICFIGKRNFRDFIEEYIEPKPGNFVHLETGEIMGQHKGVHNFTYGQRALLSGLAKPMFIAEKDLQTNDLKVAPETDHPALFVQTIYTEKCHWINKPPSQLVSDGIFNCEFRYQHLTINRSKRYCTLTLGEGNSLIVSSDQPIRAVAVGQYVVFYDGDVCLGGAKISRTGPSMYDMGERNKLTQYLDLLAQRA